MNEARKPSPEFVAKLRDLLLPKPSPPDRTEAQDRWEQRQRDMELMRRQAAIDSVWERTVAAREAEAPGFHRGPGDPDWPRR